MRNIAGVTLIEMVFGLAIVAILAGLATPGFHQSLRASAVRAATYELLAGLQQARGSSIVESQPGIDAVIVDAAGTLHFSTGLAAASQPPGGVTRQ